MPLKRIGLEVLMSVYVDKYDQTMLKTLIILGYCKECFDVPCSCGKIINCIECNEIPCICEDNCCDCDEQSSCNLCEPKK